MCIVSEYKPPPELLVKLLQEALEKGEPIKGADEYYKLGKDILI